ncbi:hypothetical protein ODJ79_37955 [Actinoplanes sp. KI2]|uniref:hypothetical protein n=1 Tax=Actinoplanes sp. KI2 TaxID=2983315 RepID=UPI0021D59980|nr:hypothetical protein [Actinoplanes sp. KI2]MCU7729535.1 hypothetical protein [Actinoplanes sp. KI2]
MMWEESHNLQGHRSEGTSLVQDLASHGYVVVTVDHVHDAFAVELPAGRLEGSFIPDPSTDEIRVTSEIVVSRVADVRFVLDQLRYWTARSTSRSRTSPPWYRRSRRSSARGRNGSTRG